MFPALMLTLLTATPQVGEVAPNFTAKDTQGNTVTLSALVEKGPVVLAFFPKAFTGGCTKELTAYRERFAELQKANATLLAVSTDKAETLEKFRQELKAPYAFLPDPQADLTTLYDVKMPVAKLSKRATFVIGAGRKVLHVETGSDAIDPEGAIKACPVTPKNP